MLKTYQESWRIRSYQADVNDRLRPAALLEMMQEMAGAHAALLNVGRNLLDDMHWAWVLTRLEVQMNRWPRSQEEITIETFPMPNRRVFFPRYFVFRDAQGEQIGCASTLWTVMDIDERRMVNPAQLVPLLPDNSDLTAPMGLPSTVTEVGAVCADDVRLPVYTDLDVNGHVNNTRYLDWCCNALGADVMMTHEMRRIVLNFHQEVRPGQAMRLTLQRNGNTFAFSGFDGEKRHFDVGGELDERQ